MEILSFKNYSILISLIFFITLLFIGISISNDYGVHWDEYNNQKFGNKWYEYSLDSIQNYKPLKIKTSNHDIIHGPFIAISLKALENLFNVKDSREVVLMRHYSTFFIFFVGVIFFYFLNKKVFTRWQYALLGSLLLVLHPRIFAHSFYNTVDIPFMVLYILSTFSLINFIEKKTYSSAILHSISCAILIDIRIAGLIVPICTFIFFSIEYIIQRFNKRLLYLISIYGFALIVCVILFWPYLWNDPYNNFLRAVNVSKFNNLPPSPWNYNLISISVTTPILYLVLFLIGVIGIILKIFKNPYIFYKNNKGITISFFLLIVPLILPIVFKTHLFDQWRHHYFIYPLIIIISLFGIREILEIVDLRFDTYKRRILRSIVFIILITSIINTYYFMYKNHPYQNTYSNFLAGKDKDLAKVNGALDYWGLSYRQLLEYILNNDNKHIIKIAYNNKPAFNNLNILTLEDRIRIKYVDIKGAQYYITNYRTSPGSLYSLKDIPVEFIEIYSIKVDEVKIAGVYKKFENQ